MRIESENSVIPGEKVKDPEPDIIFITVALWALPLYQEYMLGFTETNIMCFFFSAWGSMNHRSRQQQALCDLFVSVFSFHICRSYSKPCGPVQSLVIKTLVGINLYLSEHSSLRMHALPLQHFTSHFTRKFIVFYRGVSGVLMCTVPAILLFSIILQQWLRTADYIFKHYYSEGRGDMGDLVIWIPQDYFELPPKYRPLIFVVV